MIEAYDQTDHWRTKPGVRTRRSTAKRDKAILFTLLDNGEALSQDRQPGPARRRGQR